MKKSKLDPSYYQQLLADQYDLLRHAFESFLVWERFGDLIRDTRVGAADYPRVHFFQPITLAFVASALDLTQFCKAIAAEQKLATTVLRHGRPRHRARQGLPRKNRELPIPCLHS